MYKKIYLDEPNVGSLEKKYLNKAIDTGFVSTVGPFVSEFENKVARFLGKNLAVSTQSGTAALHVALHELGIGRGDEVIVPVLTFIATINPILYVGAKPVFVDVEKDTWNIDPEEIIKHITKRTKAIMPVHLYGNPCKMDEIMKIAYRHNLCVIEDATEALGAKYKHKFVGNWGDLGCFSFNGNKTITTGGGGLLVGKINKHIKHIKFLVNQARDASRGYYHPEVGFNYRMTNLEAAIGLAQLDRLNTLLKLKRDFHNIYLKELRGIEGLSFQAEYHNAKSLFWLTCIILENRDILTLQKRLKDKGIATRRIFTPVTDFPPYRKYGKTSYPNASRIYKKGLCLPGSTLNSKETIYYVCRTLKEIL